MLPSNVDPRNADGRSNMIGTAGGAVTAAIVYSKAPGGKLVKVALAAVSGLVAMGIIKSLV